jgi:hypothetical protein
MCFYSEVKLAETLHLFYLVNIPVTLSFGDIVFFFFFMCVCSSVNYYFVHAGLNIVLM